MVDISVMPPLVGTLTVISLYKVPVVSEEVVPFTAIVIEDAVRVPVIRAPLAYAVLPLRMSAPVAVPLVVSIYSEGIAHTSTDSKPSYPASA